VKSTDVYRTAREILAPWFKAEGFKRTRGGMLGWYKPVGDQYLLVWLQLSTDGWDTYAGSEFTVEFQRSGRPVIGEGLVRNRLVGLLTIAELEEARHRQNRVVSKLTKPPPDHDTLRIAPNVAEWYCAKFQPVSEPYRRTDDVWLRYKDEEDVRMWAQFLLRVLPAARERFLRWAAMQPDDESGWDTPG
jgi:hypothetical protein